MAVIKRQHSQNITSEYDIFRLYQSIPVDVLNIAYKLGIEILYQDDLDSETSGYIRLDSNNKWIIGINNNHHTNRQRFTIAHEIGHFILHKQHIEANKIMEDTILFRNNETNQLEIAANRFASDLLMPEKEFRQKIIEGVTSIELLSQHFEVSSLAVRYRAKALGFSGHGI